jgi:hypothetical protein
MVLAPAKTVLGVLQPDDALDASSPGVGMKGTLMQLFTKLHAILICIDFVSQPSGR